MTWQSALKAHLQADSTITDLVSERITPVKRNDPVGIVPSITYQKVEDEPQTDISGDDGDLLRVRVQIDCWSQTHRRAMELDEAIRLRMQTAAASFKAAPVSSFEEYEPDTKLYRASRDFSLMYRTS